jgi:hypothetical protein
MESPRNVRGESMRENSSRRPERHACRAPQFRMMEHHKAPRRRLATPEAICYAVYE